MAYALPLHQHGKSKVRLGRVWRDGNIHHMVEWNVDTMIESDMEHAFVKGENTGMTATDTQKNTVYVVAQRMSQKCTVEQFAIALAQHFVRTYPLVSKAKIYVEQKPWNRMQIGGLPHDHGYALAGTEMRTVYVTYDKAGKLDVTAGLKELSLLKTTQSGYEGFLRDEYTVLPEVNDRIMASTVTCTWKYTTQPSCYDAAFSAAKSGLLDAFLGPAKSGVYSPSVQYTLYNMAKNLLDRVPQAESVFLNMPNLHFIPVNPVGSKFNNDVYVATSEPHGNIEAVVTRRGMMPHAKL
ncbi:hypothetical protein VOLCADRAFT_73602 [Volvox carteri f. nagariensis]|uniref:Uricase n=1 Tax=Volvox carteri f. nagariensis TaxID=3068 RepID=D8TNZ2_VOLCA|nr:uncharacterized protein VOLCADRAFT_73602 [Volvox carteri f. nagariensis]EFJ50531.1 hypothetical protein VOLCADRAFT_73602 [Volvox carteri f. nagariensis]|eukprot:XP_002948124.1 hypothetical protein VOLCADRAFT_73602 [Volvox carteri f. nagariensis]